MERNLLIKFYLANKYDIFCYFNSDKGCNLLKMYEIWVLNWVTFKLCSLWHHTKADHVYHRVYYILHIKCNTFWDHKCLLIARIQREMTKKYGFLHPSQLNRRSLRNITVLHLHNKTFQSKRYISTANIQRTRFYGVKRREKDVNKLCNLMFQRKKYLVQIHLTCKA